MKKLLEVKLMICNNHNKPIKTEKLIIRMFRTYINKKIIDQILKIKDIVISHL